MNCANHPDRERIAFCQNCGKPLCQECTRTVGSAVYCEQCLAEKLAAAGSIPPAGTYAPPVGSAAAYGYTDPVTGAYVAPPLRAGAPNPWLAAFLGFIPGVGAMYNEQYAKGIVHLIVFAVLVSLADSHDVFGLFVAGWEFYMAIEAYHTARARRDGQPLPNPFGLNDIGERLGFDKSWKFNLRGTGNPATAVPPDPYASPFAAPYTAPYGAASAAVPPPGVAPFVPAAGTPPPSWAAPPTAGWESYAPPVPPMPYAPPVPLDAQVPYPGNRFPAGALWLIGFGTLFLVANAGFFHGFSSRLFLPFLLIGFAVFIFVRKMTSYGAGFSDDGSAAYRLRIFRALRGSAWIALVGLLFFLDEFHILTWGHSWPLFIILAGVMTVLERTAYSAAVAATPPYMPGYGYAGQPAAPAASASESPASQGTSIVPSTAHDLSRHDQEGS